MDYIYTDTPCPALMPALPWHEWSQTLWLFGGLCSNFHVGNCALTGIQGYVGGLGGWSLKERRFWGQREVGGDSCVILWW